jgi:transglutaminase-like putative cysteine protease
MARAPFLTASAVIDFDDPAIRRLAVDVSRDSELATVRSAYTRVRDGYADSYDIGAFEVSVSASDVVRRGHGICFAKAHLLAAVLRAGGIPAGLCYQKLARGDGPPGATCLHGLNAVWLTEIGRWHRLDPRGNKPGTAAPFDPDFERLAYPVRPEMAERLYPDVLAQPPSCIVELLRRSRTIAELDRDLPADLA